MFSKKQKCGARGASKAKCRVNLPVSVASKDKSPVLREVQEGDGKNIGR